MYKNSKNTIFLERLILTHNISPNIDFVNTETNKNSSAAVSEKIANLHNT